MPLSPHYNNYTQRNERRWRQKSWNGRQSKEIILNLNYLKLAKSLFKVHFVILYFSAACSPARLLACRTTTEPNFLDDDSHPRTSARLKHLKLENLIKETI